MLLWALATLSEAPAAPSPGSRLAASAQGASLRRRDGDGDGDGSFPEWRPSPHEAPHSSQKAALSLPPDLLPGLIHSAAGKIYLFGPQVRIQLFLLGGCVNGSRGKEGCALRSEGV